MFKKLKMRLVPMFVGTAMVAAPVGLGSCEQALSRVMQQVASAATVLPSVDGPCIDWDDTEPS